MARTKHAVKLVHWKGLTLIEKINLAFYGDRFFDDAADHDEPKDGTFIDRADYWATHKPDKKMAGFYKARTLIDKIYAAILLERHSFETFKWPGVGNQHEYEIIRKFQIKEAWQRITVAFSKAIEEHDVELLKDVVFILGHHNMPIQPERYYFGQILLQCQHHRLPLPTPKEAIGLMAQLRCKCDFKDIERLEQYFEVKLQRKRRKTQ